MLSLVTLVAACQPVQTQDGPAPASQPSAASTEAPHAEDHPEEAPEGIPPSEGSREGWEHYGAPFTLEGEPVSVDQALTQCVDTGDACLVEGTVERVCQRRGCWFTVASDATDQDIRIRMQDYGFFVPRDSMGQTVVFEGVLTSELISQETLQHYADDEAAHTGEPAAVVTGPERAYQFMIAGAEIQREGQP